MTDNRKAAHYLRSIINEDIRELSTYHNLSVKKRNGTYEYFDDRKISSAILKCLKDVLSGIDWQNLEQPLELRENENPFMGFNQFISSLREQFQIDEHGINFIDIEDIQDRVIAYLSETAGEHVAQRYSTYRQWRANVRNQSASISQGTRYAYEESAKYFPSPLQQFQFFDKYSRWNDDLGRRETWIETVDRAVNFLKELAGGKDTKIPQKDFEDIRKAILNLEVMPSMRLLAMAGDAARRNNLCIYNCSYLAVDRLESFKEAMLVSMSGCGVGYSVEYKAVNKLPDVQEIDDSYQPETMIIPDTTEGWADALHTGITLWWEGKDIYFDFSLIRPAGSPLKTKGGRASGPDPLRSLLAFCRKIIRSRAGKHIRPIDCHDMMCKIGEASIAGGVRRTALIALFSAGDDEMLTAKSDVNIVGNEHRWNANNSMVWEDLENPNEDNVNLLRVRSDIFFRTLGELFSGNNGEPGIFARYVAVNRTPEYYEIDGPHYATRRVGFAYGCNPCGEILLKSRQLCNLSAVIARSNDTKKTLLEKVRLATIIGTIQSAATHFPGMSEEWVRNCESERLLGVDITGQMDCPLFSRGDKKTSELFDELKREAYFFNKTYAELLGIRTSVAITCVKPSGNTSVLCNSSSGLHARFAQYYIRNVRVSASSPLCKLLRMAKVPMRPENGQEEWNATTYVVSFPVASPKNAITRKDVSAIKQLEHWLLNKQYWTEHNPSCFAGNQTVLTEAGFHSFKELWDMWNTYGRIPQMYDEYMSLATIDTVIRVEQQQIYELVVHIRGASSPFVTIRTTGDHLWPVALKKKNSRELTTIPTRDLRVGMPLKSANSDVYVVHSVTPTDSIEDVYCIQMPEGKTPYFILFNGLITHNCTITYTKDEVPHIYSWLWKNQSWIGGLSFLPRDDASYDQMPYIEITKEMYEQLKSEFPPIDFSLLSIIEHEDMTTAAQELACVAGQCEI
jgi:ribonucleoside-diphosphate reductase alpha chain